MYREYFDMNCYFYIDMLDYFRNFRIPVYMYDNFFPGIQISASTFDF